MKGLRYRALLGSFLLGGVVWGIFSAQGAEVPSLWRLVQRGTDLVFQYGKGIHPLDKIILTDEGQLGIDATKAGLPHPPSNTLLFLKGYDKAVLTTRVANTAAIANPQDGMVVYAQDVDCFKFFSGGQWSDCLGTIDRLETQDKPSSQAGIIGSIHFVLEDSSLRLYDGKQWVKVFQKLVTLGTNLPSSGESGSLFYDTQTDQFFVYDTAWFEIVIDAQGRISKQALCEDHTQDIDSSSVFRCANDKFITQITEPQESQMTFRCCRLRYDLVSDQ